MVQQPDPYRSEMICNLDSQRVAPSQEFDQSHIIGSPETAFAHVQKRESQNAKS